MRSWCRRRSGERKGEGADLCGSSSAGIRAVLAASKCTFNETLLTFKHEWPRQAKHHGSLLMAHMWSALTAEHVFYWLHVSVSVLGIHLNQGPSCSAQCIIFFCSGYRGTKTNSITTLEKPMTKAVNNRQELHWNKSLSNPTKVDKKNGAGTNRTPFLSTGGQFLLAIVIRGIVTVTVWYISNKERIESILNAELKTAVLDQWFKSCDRCSQYTITSIYEQLMQKHLNPVLFWVVCWVTRYFRVQGWSAQ